MSRQISQGFRVSLFASVSLLLGSVSSLAAAKAPTQEQTALAEFTADLCEQVAANGDDNGTDSRDAYNSTCNDDVAKLQAGNLATTAKALTRALCLHVESYSADLNETADDDATQAQQHALKNKLIKECFAAASALATKDGVAL